MAEQVVTSREMLTCQEETDVSHISYPEDMIFNMTAIALNRI